MRTTRFSSLVPELDRRVQERLPVCRASMCDGHPAADGTAYRDWLFPDFPDTFDGMMCLGGNDGNKKGFCRRVYRLHSAANLKRRHKEFDIDCLHAIRVLQLQTK